jgi:hypothetical protein
MARRRKRQAIHATKDRQNIKDRLKKKARIGTATVQSKINSFGPITTMNATIASKIIRRELECILGMFDSPRRLFNNFMLNRLTHQYGAAILFHVPTTFETVFRKYVEPMDSEITGIITGIMKATDGCSSIAVDGVTVNGKHQLLYTITKGAFSVFEKELLYKTRSM